MPSYSPMLATLVAEPFSRPGWLFETKFDGVRCIAIRKGARLAMYSRNQLRLEHKYPEIAAALAAQEADDFVIDGEIVAYQGDLTSFSRLQQRMGVVHPSPELQRSVPVWFQVFDLLALNGDDLRRLPLRERKARLKGALRFTKPLRFSDHRETDGERFYEDACKAGLEGLIAKDGDSPYVAGRSRAWQKLKCVNEQEFVIGGWTDPEGSRTGFGALLVGYYEDHKLRYAGKVGTGFGDDILRRLSARMKRIARTTSPFVDRVGGRAHWVKPEIVAQIGFTEWTGAGRLRHPRFQGIRLDKPAEQVGRERPRA